MTKPRKSQSAASSSNGKKIAPRLSFASVSTLRRHERKNKEAKAKPGDVHEDNSLLIEDSASSPRKRIAKTSSSVDRPAAINDVGSPDKKNGKKRARETDEAGPNESTSTRRFRREPFSDDEIEIIEDPSDLIADSKPTKVQSMGHPSLRTRFDAMVTSAAVARRERSGKTATVPRPSAVVSLHRSSEDEGKERGEGTDSSQEDCTPPFCQSSQKRAQNTPFPVGHQASGSGFGFSTRRTGKIRAGSTDDDDYRDGKAIHRAERGPVSDDYVALDGTDDDVDNVIVNTTPSKARTAALTTRSSHASHTSTGAIATSSAVTLDANSSSSANAPPLGAPRANIGKKRVRDSDDDLDDASRESKRAKQPAKASRIAATTGSATPLAVMPNPPAVLPNPQAALPVPPAILPNPFPILLDPPVALAPLPGPYYLDIAIADTGSAGIERLRLAHAPGVAPAPLELAHALGQATHLRLRPEISFQVSEYPLDALFEITAREYDSILHLAPRLSWIFFEDMVVVGDRDEHGGNHAQPRALEVLSFSTGSRSLGRHQSILRTLLAPFNKVDHVYFDARHAGCPIPTIVKIKGWHFPGTCGDWFPGEVKRYIEAGNAIETLNFVGGPHGLDNTTTRAMRELLRTAAPNLKFLGVGAEMLKRVDRDMDFDEAFVSKVSFPRLTRLAVHLPFGEDNNSPCPSSDTLREEYPDEFQSIHRPFITTLSFLKHLRIKRTAPNVQEITSVLHGTLPNRSTTAECWWSPERNIRLDTFNNRAAGLLGVASRDGPRNARPDYTKTVCVDMSHLLVDNGFPIDLAGDETWMQSYLFPCVQARKVWVGPRTLTAMQRRAAALNLPPRAARPEYALRSYLGLPEYADSDDAEQFCAVVHCVDAGGSLRHAWNVPGVVCPRWCAGLWWSVVGSSAVR